MHDSGDFGLIGVRKWFMNSHVLRMNRRGAPVGIGRHGRGPWTFTRRGRVKFKSQIFIFSDEAK
jgi:hypothetical protein